MLKILSRDYGDNVRVVGLADGTASAEDPDGLPMSELLRLADASLPLAERMKCSQGLNDRAYYLDAEGWVRDGLAAAVRRCGAAAPCAGEAMAHMRFLLYAEAGGGLPPHVDLTRTDHRGRTSTHTFILYLTDCAAGGETVLLEAIAQPSGVVATVTPKKGRLFVFPHAHPHMAREVVAELVQAEGVGGLYRGALERVLRSAPQFAITLSAFDVLRQAAVDQGLLTIAG